MTFCVVKEIVLKISPTQDTGNATDIRKFPEKMKCAENMKFSVHFRYKCRFFPVVRIVNVSMSQEFG